MARGPRRIERGSRTGLGRAGTGLSPNPSHSDGPRFAAGRWPGGTGVTPYLDETVIPGYAKKPIPGYRDLFTELSTVFKGGEGGREFRGTKGAGTREEEGQMI